LIQGTVFWILMGQSLLIRDRELEPCGIFSGRVDVWSGGVEVEDCLSKNEIRSGHFLGGICFGNLIGIYSAYIRHICFVAILLPISIHLMQRPYLLIIYLLLKKN
jgi:hypothetical protein